MNSKLQAYWDKSSATIPNNKEPSAYALDKERLFPRQAVICDLGSGSGVDGLYFARQGHIVKLIDISDVALKQAKEMAKKQNLGGAIETFQSNLDEVSIPLQSEVCDVVYSRLALHYFEPNKLTALLTEVCRILKPGGKAFLTLKSPDDVAEMEYLTKQAVQLEAGVFDEDGYVKTRYSIEQLKNIFANAEVTGIKCNIHKYTEDLGDRKDKVKSGNTNLIVNEITLLKC